MEIYGDTATVYRDFAREAYGSECFRDWASSVAEDPDVLTWLQTLPEKKRQANLVFAAARWHGVPAPGPYAGLRTALLGDGDAGPIRRTILERSTQTNEVGRLATLYPAIAEVAPHGRGRSIALLEVGASAGLCLYPDRYTIRWKFPDGTSRETDEGMPLLECETTGEPPTWALSPVVWRSGIDLSPVDVTDDDAVRWLQNLVWPEQEERRERLRAAVAIARQDPPYLVRGDLLDELPALVEQSPPDATLVVFHSAVIAYLEQADRERFAVMMTDLVATGRCHWVSNEGPRVLPGLVPPRARIPFGRFVLAVDGRAVALTHGHGAELDWL
ncbi:MAG: DUF2332 domain-containing protein [Nocardioides sp.]